MTITGRATTVVPATKDSHRMTRVVEHPAAPQPVTPLASASVPAPAAG